ncbi:probable LRR receptor-like serine/threonine-protein kinase At1g51810 [Hordeum vulgare subsp. vulgare]|uniref:non-specific serine/threonine protein kinase n=1 Tax=Hordeum vulgare subsp. vulgare TaxID=112509 RepID=A0A8I7BAR7_HORVV|nr:probable LRR receptor-like serine/threonine-protein kinase At1g51810 [Hordeum vulgare subsp. vulgare]
MVINFICWQRTKLAWILALLLNLVMTIQVHGQPPPSGFISIDCGLRNSSSYNDSTTGLWFNPDGGFVEGGTRKQISQEFMADAFNEQQKTMRSFPDSSRNCYTLPSTIGKKYLVRAMFTYGNYDGLNKTLDGSVFLFGLHIGVNFWGAVNLTNMSPSAVIPKEVLTVAPSNSLSVCLVNFGSGIPFISSLELRPLQDTMYPFVNSSVSIGVLLRTRFGNVTDLITRYPTDTYDRFWKRFSTSYPGVNLYTTNKVESLPGNNFFNIPSVIMQHALTVDMNFSRSRIIIPTATHPNLDTKSLHVLPIFHFAEINGSNPNRRFDIYGNGELLFSDFSPSRFQVDSMHQNGRFLPYGNGSFLMNKTSSSTLKPLINAVETYFLVRMDKLTTNSEDVNYMKEVKNHYNLTQINWNGDPCSPREYSWEGLTCHYSKSNQNPRIVSINLSASGLKGGLALSFLNMVSLENLDLSHNNLTGAIPDYQIKTLKILDLSNNQLVGPIPDSILRKFQAGLLDLRLEGNPVCSKFKDTYCSNKKKNTIQAMVIAVIVPVVLVSLLVLMCIMQKLCWGGKSDHEDYAMYEEETSLHVDLRRFTYVELKIITNDFQSIIGKGGFGIVYHGKLENGDEVAVKVLMETSIAESTDFLPEVETLSKVHHKNLVTLKGYCQNKKCLALIYDFMSRGNLQQLIRGGDDYSLKWEQRLHIALDAAQGLEYLHESCTPSIVHRDVKTPNILLDKNLVGIISDFGLSRAFNDAHTHISTVAAGTLGYLDPEYHATFQLTVKTDVYSFGIVLLEIITGQPPVLMEPQTFHLPNWVRHKIAMGNIHDIVDKRLLDQYDASSLQSVVDLAMNCVENAAIDRPTMTDVVSRLKELLPVVASEKMSGSASTSSMNPMDAEIRRQFQLTISGISNEEYSFRSGYTGGMSDLMPLSGR